MAAIVVTGVSDRLSWVSWVPPVWSAPRVVVGDAAAWLTPKRSRLSGEVWRMVWHAACGWILAGALFVPSALAGHLDNTIRLTHGPGGFMPGHSCYHRPEPCAP